MAIQLKSIIPLQLLESITLFKTSDISDVLPYDFGLIQSKIIVI